MTNYYDDEFKKVSGIAFLRLQLQDENGKTKWINVNQDSVNALLRFLDKEGFSI